MFININYYNEEELNNESDQYDHEEELSDGGLRRKLGDRQQWIWSVGSWWNLVENDYWVGYWIRIVTF